MLQFSLETMTVTLKKKQQMICGTPFCGQYSWYTQSHSLQLSQTFSLQESKEQFVKSLES